MTWTSRNALHIRVYDSNNLNTVLNNSIPNDEMQEWQLINIIISRIHIL